MAATICVYGSSSTRTKQSYLTASFELGAAIAKRGHVCINGGGKFGCMVSIDNVCALHILHIPCDSHEVNFVLITGFS